MVVEQVGREGLRYSQGMGVDRTLGMVSGWNGKGFQYAAQTFGSFPASAGSWIGELHCVAFTPVARQTPEQALGLTGRWSCRESPVLPQTLRGRPF